MKQQSDSVFSVSAPLLDPARPPFDVADGAPNAPTVVHDACGSLEVKFWRDGIYPGQIEAVEFHSDGGEGLLRVMRVRDHPDYVVLSSFATDDPQGTPRFAIGYNYDHMRVIARWLAKMAEAAERGVAVDAV